MTSLDIARQGRIAARQIRSQMEAGVLMVGELDRLLKKVEAGFEQMVPEADAPAGPPAARGFAPIVHDGGRA